MDIHVKSASGKVVLRRSGVFALPAFLAVVLGIAAGCGGSGGSGVEIPAGMKVTALGDVLANPGAWKDKDVLLEGTVAWMCPSGCEFTLADGKHSADVYPREFKLEKYKKGQPLRILARIVVGSERTIISARAIEKR